jgi:hypothetical protein
MTVVVFAVVSGTMRNERAYPDIAAILAQKERGRSERAALSFADKLDALERLKENVAPIVEARRRRAGKPLRGHSA